MADSSKIITLQPSWKIFFLSYLYSVLLIPVFGIGLIALWFVWKKHHQYTFKISDTNIKAIDSDFTQNIDLANITSIRVKQRWIDQKFDVGTLILKTDQTEMEIIGKVEPYKFKEMIEKAAAVQRKHQQEKQKTQPRKPKSNPGEMERMNYLTGLWQQGLISDDDFDNEKKGKS